MSSLDSKKTRNKKQSSSIEKDPFQDRADYFAIFSQIQQLLPKLGAWKYDKILELLGLVCDATTIHIWENYRTVTENFLFRQRCQWYKTHFQYPIYNSQQQSFSPWIESLDRGKIVQKNVAEFTPSEKKLLANSEIKSILIIPIILKDSSIGLISLENCDRAKTYEKVIINLLKATAAAIAIHYQSEQRQANFELIKFAMDRAPDRIFWIDKNAQFFYVNQAGCESLGYTPEELLSMKVFDIDPNADSEFWAKHWQETKTNGILCLETLHQTKQGKVFPVEIRANYLQFENQGYLCCFARDISDRKQAQQQLEENTKRFQTLLNQVPVGIFHTDLEGNFIFVNPRWLEITGLSSKEAMGKGWFNALHPDDRAKINREWNKMALTGKESVIEYRLKSARGEEKWVFSRTVPIDDDTGICTGYFGTITDITDRKNMEQELQESEKRYRSLYQNTPIMLHSIDTEGKLVNVNKYWLEKLGYKKNEVIGKHSTDFLTEESRAYAVNTIFPEFYRTGFSKEISYQFRKKNGEILDVLLNAIAERDKAGNLVRAQAATIDVTDRNRAEAELRLSEQRFRQIFNHSNDAIVVIDPDRDRILDCNQTACRMLQYNRQELLSIPISRVHPHDMPQVREFSDRVIKNGHGWTDKLSCLTKNNLILHAEISAATSYLAGQPCIIASIRDISDRKQAEKALQQINQELEIRISERTKDLAKSNNQLQAEIQERKQAERKIEESLKEKEILLKEIHHRVKNNLFVVSSLLEMQSDQIEDPAVFRIFEESQNRIYSMALIHEQLYRSTDLATVDFSQYLKALVAHLSDCYNLDSQRIRCQLDVETITLNIETAHPYGLIINELVANALEHAFPNNRSGKIWVSLKRDRDNKIVSIVKDNGIGLPKNFNLQETDSLGMQLVFTLTEQLEGKIEIENCNGTSFKIVFSELNYTSRF